MRSAGSTLRGDEADGEGCGCCSQRERRGSSNAFIKHRWAKKELAWVSEVEAKHIHSHLFGRRRNDIYTRDREHRLYIGQITDSHLMIKIFQGTYIPDSYDLAHVGGWMPNKLYDLTHASRVQHLITAG